MNLKKIELKSGTFERRKLFRSADKIRDMENQPSLFWLMNKSLLPQNDVKK